MRVRNLFRRDFFKFVISFFVSILYSSVLLLIPEFVLRDRHNYLMFATNSLDLINSNLKGGVLKVLFNEPLFLGVNYWLSKLVEPEFIPRIFSFFISFTLMFFILRNSKTFLIGIIGFLLVFFMPFMFNLQLVALRQGLAISIFLITVLISKKQQIWLTCLFLMGFIHSSAFFVFTFLCILNMLFFFELKLRFFILILISVFSGFFILLAAGLFSMRQADEYANLTASVSGGMFVVYTLLLMLLVYEMKHYSTDEYTSFAILGLLVYLSLYFTSPIAGRLITWFLPFILYSFLKINSKLKYLYIFMFLALQLAIFKSTIVSNSLVNVS